MIEAIIERAATQFLVQTDAFSIYIGGDDLFCFLYFWTLSFSKPSNTTLQEVIARF